MTTSKPRVVPRSVSVWALPLLPYPKLKFWPSMIIPAPGTSGNHYRQLYFPVTTLDILKIGRIILIAIKPTKIPIRTIIMGSIIDVTVLMTVLSSLAW